MRELIIFGATTLARLAHHYAVHDLGYIVRAFVVDEEYRTSDAHDGIPVISWTEALSRFSPDQVDCFVAVGYKKMRARAHAYARAKAAGYHLCNLISPSSYCANNAQIGDNTLIMPHAVIEPYAVIGSNNVIWSNATICHEAVIGDHNFIAANVTLGGHVTIGNLNFIGFSATIEQQARIGNETLIGAQSYLRGTTEDLHRYWGVPAKAHGALDATIGIEID